MKSKKSLASIPDKLKVVAVCKGRSINQIQAILERTHAKRIGENRLNEAKEKFPDLPKLEKHFLGKLQSRKIPEIVKTFDVIQSLENLKQAKLISAQGKVIQVFLQINLSGLPHRSGAKPQEVTTLIKEIQKLPNIELMGVMGIASQDKTKAKKEFALLKSLQGDLAECSMGMSDDYPLALEMGSTLLRLGRALFQDPPLQFPFKFE